MAHLHSVYDNDTHFKIDPATRQIANESGKVILMQNDHNSERFTFEIPRYIDGHDMSVCNKVEVHFINLKADKTEKHADVYPVEDLQISPASEDVVICSWLISQNATKYAGSLNFVLRYACLTGSVIDYQWYTDIHKGISVSESISNTESVATEYSDILEAWREELMASGGATDGGGNCNITRIESLEETGIRNLRELDSGIYILYGYFNAYPGAPDYMPFDNRLVTVEKQTAGSHLFVFQTLNARVDFHEILVDESAEDGFTHTWTKIDLLALNSGGNVDQGTGLTSTEKNLMLTLLKAVPYQTDASATMKSLEAIWNSGSSGGETPDIPDVTNYTVTYNLTSVTADSTPASVVEGGSLTVNLTPDTNAVLGEVVVTMGGVDVTATAYSNGKISISSVTGNVIITATATVASYTQVEYLEVTSATGYMVTPVALRPTDLVECVWSGGAGWVSPFGAYGKGVHCSLATRRDGVAGRTAYTRRSGGTYANRNTADPAFIMPSNSNGVYRFTESTPGTGTIYDADGNALVTLTDEEVSGYSGNGTVLGLFYIFNSDLAQMHGNVGNVGLRIYSFKITDVYGVAVLDLIPVLDENNVACMYDKVSGEYLYDASGENAFTAGGAV